MIVANNVQQANYNLNMGFWDKKNSCIDMNHLERKNKLGKSYNFHQEKMYKYIPHNYSKLFQLAKYF